MVDNQNPAEISFPEVAEAPVSWGEINLLRADNFKAIVTLGTGKVFSIVSKDYKLIRHEQAAEQIESTINEFPKLGKFSIETQFYNDGGRMRRTYRFIDKPVEITPGDLIDPELHLYNSYDVTWPFIVLLGAFRFVCANGLVVGKKFLYFRKRHVFDIGQIDLQSEVSTAMKRLRSQTKQWKKWSNQRLTSNTFEKVMEAMKFGKKAREEISEYIAQETVSYTCDGIPVMTLWIFYNVLAWYITHHAVSLNHRVEMERKLRSAMNHFRGN